MTDRQSCLFCRIVDGELPSTRLHDDDLVIAIRDIEPEAPTHILLIPRRTSRRRPSWARRMGRCWGACSRSRRTSRGRGRRRRRLPTRDEHRRRGRPDRAPPARPPARRPPDAVAARMRRGGASVAAWRSWARGRRRGRRLLADRRRGRDLSGRVGRAGQDRVAGRRPDARPARVGARWPEPHPQRHGVAVPAARVGVPRVGAAGGLPGDAAGRPERRLHRRLRVHRHGRRPQAAAEQQAYLATGPGAVQSPLGTVHVLRQVGNTLVVLRLAAGFEQGSGRPGHPGRARDARRRVPVPG